MKRTLVILAICLSLVLPVAAQAAVFNMARDYIPPPPGTFVNFLYFEHVSADKLYVNNHINFNDIGLSENVGLYRPIYWFEAGPEWLPMIIDANFIIPFGNVSISASSAGTTPAASNLAPFISTSATGVGDLLWIDTFWFIHNNTTKTYLAFTPIEIFPTGNYRESKLLSLGANRFSFDEQLGFVQGVTVIPGHDLFFDIIPQVQFYTNNTNFSNRNAQASISARDISTANALARLGGPTGFAGTGTLSQGAEFALEGHISYDLTKAMWASVDYYGRWGARQEWEGINLHTNLDTQTLGFTAAYAFAAGYQLAFQYTTDLEVKSGTQNQTFLARFLWATDLNGLLGNPK